MEAQLSNSPHRLALLSRVCAGAELGDFFCLFVFEPVVLKWWHHLYAMLVMSLRFPPLCPRDLLW